MIYKVTMNDMC